MTTTESTSTPLAGNIDVALTDPLLTQDDVGHATGLVQFV